MTDDSEDTVEVRRPSVVQKSIRRLSWLLAAVFMVWVYMTQGTKPRLPHPPQALNPVPAAAPLLSDAPPAPTAVETHITEIPTDSRDEEIALLKQRLEQLEAKSEKTPADGADKERVALLEAHVNEQAKSVEEMKAQVAEMQALKAKLSESSAQSSRVLSAFTAIGLIREALHNGTPFSAPLDHLYTLASPDAAGSDAVLALLEKLKPYAETGAPTLERLQSRFGEFVTPALDPEYGNHSWQQNLKSLVRIRKIGEHVEGANDEAVIARAEAKLAQRDVNAAIGEMQALSPRASDAFAGWSRDAQALITTSAAIDALQIAFAAETGATKAP